MPLPRGTIVPPIDLEKKDLLEIWHGQIVLHSMTVPH